MKHGITINELDDTLKDYLNKLINASKDGGSTEIIKELQTIKDNIKKVEEKQSKQTEEVTQPQLIEKIKEIEKENKKTHIIINGDFNNVTEEGFYSMIGQGDAIIKNAPANTPGKNKGGSYSLIVGRSNGNNQRYVEQLALREGAKGIYHRCCYATSLETTWSEWQRVLFSESQELKTQSKDVIGAINEVFQYGNNVKKKIVDALLQLNKGLQIREGDEWGQIEKAVKAARTSKKIASGKVSKGALLRFNVDNHNEKGYCIEVDNLGFSPQLIITMPDPYAASIEDVEKYTTYAWHYHDLNFDTIVNFDRLYAHPQSQFKSSGFRKEVPPESIDYDVVWIAATVF